MSRPYALPKHGTPWAELEPRLDALVARDPDELHARMSFYSMKGSDEVQALLLEACAKAGHKNNLVAPLMPGMQQIEEELLAMAAGLLSGGVDSVVANITSGGTESIFCALHAARERARTERPEVTRPEFVAPYCAHATFSKGAHYLGIEVTRVPVGPDYRADPRAIDAAISPRTIGLYASAPCWPYGLYDPVREIAAIAERHGLWLHVDACVGGFMAPFARRLGHPIPDWDFAVPGVSSISADLHKYAYAMKPASIVAWRSAELQRHHYTIVTDWPTVPYVAQGFVGSRPAGATVAAWAVMHFLGEDGYLDYTRRTFAAKDRLTAGLRAIDGVRVWDTDLCILCYETEGMSPFDVVGGMQALGWVHFGTLEPPLVQLVLDPLPDEVVERYLADVRRVVADVRAGRGAGRGAVHYAEVKP